MVTMGVKMLWTLALFVISCTSQSQGELTEERVTYLTLRNGQQTGSTYTGRVVVRFNNEGVDGAICGQWTREDALVTCRMLGYNDGQAVQYNPIYQIGNHNYLMSNLRCNGQESSLSSCPRDPIVNCPYDSRDVIVSCTNPSSAPVSTYSNGVVAQANRVTQSPVPVADLTSIADYTNCAQPGNIRLHGISSRPGMGYVQVLVNGAWQYICDDSWSENDAKVVCRELCYTDPTLACARPGVESRYAPIINDSPLNIAWNNVQCRGDENNLNSCLKNNTTPQGRCSRTELAGVQCVVPPEDIAAMNAQLDCADVNGDLLIHFTQNTFPGLNDNNIRVVSQQSGGTVACPQATRQLINGNYDVRIPKGACGTTGGDNGTHICYQNTVEYDNEAYLNNVLLDYKKKTFTVGCCMPTDKDISIKFIPKTQEFTQSISQNFDYVPDISFYVNERCDQRITDNPYSVQVGDWVYIGVSVKAENESLFRDSDLKLVVTSCTANPIVGSSDSSIILPENITLIDNKCPASLPSVTTYPISNTTEGFRFKAFKFYGYSSVYVTCHLRVCLSSDTKPLCDRSCNSAIGQGRKRRDLTDELTGLERVVSGTLQIVDPREPQGKALPPQSHEDRTVERINPRFLKP